VGGFEHPNPPSVRHWHGSLSRTTQEESEAALLFLYSLFTEVPAQATSGCSLFIWHSQLRTVYISAQLYFLSLSDSDTNSEHLPIADIANRESIRMWEGELNRPIHIAWQVHACTPNKLYLFPFNIHTSQCSMTSLSSQLLGCLVRDLYYGPWPVAPFASSYVASISRISDNFKNDICHYRR
jgi:hypothetical protein